MDGWSEKGLTTTRNRAELADYRKRQLYIPEFLQDLLISKFLSPLQWILHTSMVRQSATVCCVHPGIGFLLASNDNLGRVLRN